MKKTGRPEAFCLPPGRSGESRAGQPGSKARAGRIHRPARLGASDGRRAVHRRPYQKCAQDRVFPDAESRHIAGARQNSASISDPSLPLIPIENWRTRPSPSVNRIP